MWVQQENDESRSEAIARTLETLRGSIVIVEGDHDVSALESFSVKAVSYNKLIRQDFSAKGKIVYILTDNDRGGEEKKQKIQAFLLETSPECIINEGLGKHLLEMLNVTGIEQIRGPIVEAMQKGGGEILTGKNW